MTPKKGNWIVKTRCEVHKDIYCENCTEEEAMKNPFDYAELEIETDQIDWEVESVEPND